MLRGKTQGVIFQGLIIHPLVILPAHAKDLLWCIHRKYIALMTAFSARPKQVSAKNRDNVRIKSLNNDVLACAQKHSCKKSAPHKPV